MSVEFEAPAWAQATLTRTHFKRLRFYWSGGRQDTFDGRPASERGGASRTDGIDLELAGMGLIRRLHNVSITHFAITPAGEVALAHEHQREIERRRPHHALAGRLAQWLVANGRVTWEGIEVRVSPANVASARKLLSLNDDHDAPTFVKPDVYSVEATGDPARARSCVHEVKVSRADFLADVANPAKRLGYASCAEAVYYACPAGVLSAADMPHGCGLVVETAPGHFEVLARAKRRAIELDARHYLTLMLKPFQLQPLA